MRARRRPFVWLLSFLILSFVLPFTLHAQESLEGIWQHQADSNGWKGKKGANITLTFARNGKATLSATSPVQSPVTVSGTWSQAGGRITLNIPNEMELQGKPFQLNGDTLTLPVQAASDGPGTSTWVRMRAKNIDAVFVAFNRALEEGKGGATAAEDAATEARKQENVEKVDVVSGGKALVVTVKTKTPSAVKPKVYILFANKSAPFSPIKQGKLPISPLAADPRVRLVPQNPPGDPDVPKTKTALVVAPFHSKVYYAYSKAIWKEGASKPQYPELFAKTSTFKELGDDPDGIINVLRDKAHYEVTSLIDDQATPGAIYRALQSHPSLIYFGTHGAPGSPEDRANGIAAAGMVAARTVDKRPGRTTWEQVRANLSQMLDEQKVPEAARAGITAGCLEEENGISFCFPLLWPKFFEAALGGHGAPDGFVFIDACYSGQYSKLAETFKPKAYFGYDEAMNGWSTARFAKYMFQNLAHKGHTAREAEVRLRHLTKGAGVVWLEDSILSPAIGKADADLKEDATHLKTWGSDSKDYDDINNSVFWLMIMARMSNDINKGADSLSNCFDQYWKAGKRPGLAATFCNNGIIGSHTPTAEEVDDARHLVSGKPSSPHGRFTLH